MCFDSSGVDFAESPEFRLLDLSNISMCRNNVKQDNPEDRKLNSPSSKEAIAGEFLCKKKY